MLSQLADHGQLMANDFGHTAANIAGSNQDLMWPGLSQYTQILAPKTKLLHINTVGPPFNGTDSHHGILAEDWQHGAFPNEDQLKSLLTLFKGRDDVWAVPEPQDNAMIANYLALQKYATDLAL